MSCILLPDRILWIADHIGSAPMTWAESLFVTVLATLIVFLAALPLRDTIQEWVEWLSPQRRVNYRQLLQDYSRVLTTRVSLPRLLNTMAEQAEEVLHPLGLAIILGEGLEFKVALSRGKLASHKSWREGTSFASKHFIATQLATRHRALLLPKHIRDLASSQRPEWLQLEASGVHVLVPMYLRGSLVGWLVLGSKLSERSYTQKELDFLGALVDQSCVAIESARLYGEMQQRATELAMIAMVSSAISSSLDVEQVLQTIVESVIQVVNCDKSAIFELSEDGSELCLRMGRGLSAAYIHRSRHISLADDARARAVSTQQPLIVSDTQANPHLTALAALAEQEGYRAVIDMPLVGREGPLGVLSVYFHRIHSSAPSEMEILTTFANHAAIAIENARLYAAVTHERDRVRRLYKQTDAALARRVQELTAIAEISRQLTGTLDAQRVMDLVLEQAMQATEADRGAIALYEPEQQVMWLTALKNYPPEFEHYRSEPWPVSRGVIGRVVRTGEAALVPDVTRDPDYVKGVPTTHCQLGVPIVHDRQVLGVLLLESDRRTAFVQEHVRFIQLLAEHAAIGINNAQLFQRVVEGRDQLQAILNSTQDVVVMFDTDTNVILINPRVRELFGPKVERWLWSVDLLNEVHVPDSPLFRTTDMDPSRLAKLIDQIRKEPRQPAHIAFSFEKDGWQRYMEGAASPVLGEKGEVLGRVVVLRDVTRQRELEEFRTELTSMIVHNLQGPLAALISSLDTLLENGQADSDVAAELLRIAASSGRKLHSRIESVLWIRCLEDRQMPLNLQAHPLSDVVQPVMREYKPMAASTGVRLESAINADLPPVLVDDEIVGRVFSNLLDNAFKHTPQGGQIQVQATLESGAGGPVVLCVVADTGSGIAASVQDVLFDKFRRAGQPLHGRRRGMGIGLHYCKLAVETHGGRIWVESQPGQGCTFYFTLPATACEPA